jgi:DNA-binding NtrC family response regulator
MSLEKLSILVVDDEQVVRDSLAQWFTEEGYAVEACESAAEALARLAARGIDLVIADIRMPGIDGMELLEKIKTEQLETAVIMMTGYASVETAVRALKQGAFDYITKPFDPDDLLVVVRNALEQRRLKLENRALRQRIEDRHALDELVGQSVSMRQVREQIGAAAGVTSPVLIQGERGSGRELVARTIHRLGPRRYNHMLAVHCGALTDALMESELFGHEKGAFAGAQFRKKGKFEAAMGGTVFLDEIADTSPKTQTDLLRVIQERRIMRAGGMQSIPVDFRVIAATSRNLDELIKAGRFRSDLYYRLSVLTIHVPPLRDRHGDVPLLAAHFLDKFSHQMNRRFTGLDRAAVDLLVSHHWPGNVRELENVMERAVVVGREPVIRAQDLAVTRPPEAADDLRLENVERRHITRVLESFGWNQTQSARALGIDRVTLYHKIRRYNLKPPGKVTRA